MGKLILNGVEYSTSGNLYYPVIYSDTERKIGVWRDNKPVYQKTINFGALPNADQKAVNHNITDLDNIVSVSAVASGATNNFSLSYIDTNSLANGIGIYVSNTAVTIRCGSNRSSYNAYVTLQYTKTTDTAGSGNWNTDGIPTHHYSTNEQVIGTWMGKPLYEQVLPITQTLNISANTWTETEFPQGDKKALYKAVIVNDSGAVIEALSGGFVNSNVALNSPRAFNVVANTGSLILQYTKTTD